MKKLIEAATIIFNIANTHHGLAQFPFLHRLWHIDPSNCKNLSVASLPLHYEKGLRIFVSSRLDLPNCRVDWHCQRNFDYRHQDFLYSGN